jgi:O-antigen ligase
MVYYDYKWYGDGFIAIPFVSVVMATTCTSFLLVIKRSLEKISIKMPKEFRAILFFFFVVQLSIIGMWLNAPTDPKIKQFLKTDMHLFFYVFFVFVIIQLLSGSIVNRLIRFYYVCGIIIASFGILQFIHLNLFEIPGMNQMLFGSRSVYSTKTELARVSSIFNEPSWFAYFLLDWMGIGLVYILTRNRRMELPIFVLLLMAFFCCASLGGYVGLSIFVFLVSLEFETVRSKIFLMAIICAIPLLFGTVISHFFTAAVTNRLQSVVAGADPSLMMRLDSFQAAFQVWQRNLLFGVGLGNASFYTPDFYKGIWLHVIKVGKFHAAVDSAFFLLLAENGIIGFAAFIAMIMVIVKRSWPESISRRMFQNLKLNVGDNKNMFQEKLWFLTKIFRIIVIVNFVELLVTGGLLFPRFWFNIAIYLFLKGRIRREFRDSPVFLTQDPLEISAENQWHSSPPENLRMSM